MKFSRIIVAAVLLTLSGLVHADICGIGRVIEISEGAEDKDDFSDFQLR